MHTNSHPEYREDSTQDSPASPATSPVPEEHSPGVIAMAGRKFRIAGDEVNRATADLPDEQRSAIRWLHAHAAENDLSLNDLGQLVRLSGATMSLVFRGKYEAKLDGVVAAILDFKRMHEKRQTGRKLAFIPTALTQRIWAACEAALEFQRTIFIWGDSQIGKTSALMAYRDAHNHGQTIFLRMPVPCSMGNFLAALGEALRISPQQKEKELRRRILSAFDDRMLLIVDECHQAMFSRRRGSHPLEFLRELHDLRGCGLVLCGTNVFRDEMERGYLADIMRQTKLRRLCALQLPDRPTRADLNTFAEAYGLAPATGEARKLEYDMIQEEALGMWLTLLRMGAKIAAQRKQRLDWSHVLAAHAGLRELEGTAQKAA